MFTSHAQSFRRQISGGPLRLSFGIGGRCVGGRGLETIGWWQSNHALGQVDKNAHDQGDSERHPAVN